MLNTTFFLYTFFYDYKFWLLVQNKSDPNQCSLLYLHESMWQAIIIYSYYNKSHYRYIEFNVPGW